MEYIMLKKTDIGKGFIADIDGAQNIKGNIAFEGNSYYLCQNSVRGAACSNKLGYKFSWCILDASRQSLIDNSVTNLRVVYPERDWDEEENYKENSYV